MFTHGIPVIKPGHNIFPQWRCVSDDGITIFIDFIIAIRIYHIPSNCIVRRSHPV
ncbi:hypothetical protein KXV44_006273, partial [Aspergillus fumigatus]